MSTKKTFVVGSKVRDKTTGEATLDSFQVVAGRLPDGRTRVSNALTHTKRRDGQYAVTLPDGSVIVVASPAWR